MTKAPFSLAVAPTREPASPPCCKIWDLKSENRVQMQDGKGTCRLQFGRRGPSALCTLLW